MRKIVLASIISGLSFVSFSQVLTLTNQSTGEPVELATLMSDKPKAFVITNAKGQANIAEFRSSEKIEIRALSYKNIITSYAELEAESFKLQMAPSAVSMEEVVIAATRWSQTSGDVPARIVSVSPKTINLQNPQTSADLLGISGKVFIQKSQQGGGSPMIRGFATNRLLYSVDGVRMNNAIFRGGNLQNVISLDPFANEKTEILFGPGSVIYGSDAIGGVMSFQTLTPQFSLSEKPLIAGKAVTRFSSANNEKTGHFDINVGYNNWAFLTSISSFNYGDLRMGSHGPEEYLRPLYVQRQDSTDVTMTNEDPLVQRPSGYSQINMMQKVHFKPGVKWDFQYGFHYSETSSYSRYDRHIRYKNGLPRYGEWSYGPQKWMMNSLNITNIANKDIFDRVSLRIAQQYFEESRVSRDINQPDREIRTEGVDALSANLDFIKSMNSKNKLYYGVEYVLNLVSSEGINENILDGSFTTGPSRYPQADWTSIAIYINDQYKISESFLLQAGFRYNQFILNAEFDNSFYPFPFTTANLNDGALTGSIGAVHRPTEEWVISTNLA
ncbi:MAG: TonB-dependent receptor, partial [Bacteroidales bacterium]|nr:TonB-dependent receptor [Bacteroidales bacterium]